VAWSEPYVDYSGAGTMTTVSSAVYISDASGFPKLIGVAGIDIVIDKFLKVSIYKNIIT
jgi:hypothetical protein